MKTMIFFAFSFFSPTVFYGSNHLATSRLKPDSSFFPFTTIFLLFPIITLLCGIKFHTQWNKNNKNAKKSKRSPLPPGPKPWPLLGCLPQMLMNKPTYKWIHNLMESLDTEIACIRLGNVHVIPVTSPTISREFLKKQDAIFASRPMNMSSRVASGGYLTTALVPFGEQWRKMKKVLTTEFLSASKHQWFHVKRVEEADHLVRYVYNQCKDPVKGGMVNVRIAAQHYCANVTKKMVFNRRFFGEGMEDGGPGIEEQEHVDALFTILAYLFSFCISDYLPGLVGLDLDGHEEVINKCSKVVRKYQDPIIEERVKLWMSGSKKEVEDLLDALITSKDANGNLLLTNEEIKAQIVEVMLETVDNPSNAVEWAIAEMINQPELLERAIEELDRVVGRERLVQEQDFSQLNYIKACAKESFRLHPIAPFNVPHVSITDTTIAGYFIPKGSHVLISRKGVGRNPKVWDEPLIFKPERHLKEDGSPVMLTDPDLNLISFSTGRRGCIGVTLGTSMTVMLFARLLQGFTWRAPRGQESINLCESDDSLALAKPLVALATPRLPKHVYPV